mmetsp:Transcript_2322/g.2288  ORF Transcript_2322/g.2288 Transcript_2322/m.2288 type:complete len:383 (-) Transcript_2322:82-1230(-)
MKVCKSTSNKVKVNNPSYNERERLRETSSSPTMSMSSSSSSTSSIKNKRSNSNSSQSNRSGITTTSSISNNTNNSYVNLLKKSNSSTSTSTSFSSLATSLQNNNTSSTNLLNSSDNTNNNNNNNNGNGNNNSNPIPPRVYFEQILKERGYEFKSINGLDSLYRIVPSTEQLSSYDNPLLQAIRNNDLNKINELKLNGHLMQACNNYCESILHFSARRGTKDVVKYLLANGAYCFVDDCGRLPMHDVCWRHFAKFEIVSLFLEHDLDMLFVKDRHGAYPLDYVNPRQYQQWCNFLDSIKDKYWPVKPEIIISPEVIDETQIKPFMQPLTTPLFYVDQEFDHLSNTNLVENSSTPVNLDNEIYGNEYERERKESSEYLVTFQDT